MAGRQKDTLHPLTPDERSALELVSHSRTNAAKRVVRATDLLSVAQGSSYQAPARAAGRRSGDAVAHLVARFNRAGVDAVTTAPGFFLDSWHANALQRNTRCTPLWQKLRTAFALEC